MSVWRRCSLNDAYEVSDDGRVRRGGRELKPFLAKSTGYLQVELGGKRYSMHRLVALEFCQGKDADNCIVNHRNGIRADNRAENLEWCTHAYNHAHSYEHGRIGSCKGKIGELHPTSKPVKRMDRDGNTLKIYLSAMDAVREGFESSCISRCCQGQSKTHLGYQWQFA